MTSVILQLLFGLGCAGIGFLAGLSMSWRKYRIGSARFSAPALPRTDKQQAYVLIVVSLLSGVSVVTAAVQSERQTACNQDFRENLIARSSIANDDRQSLNEMMSVVADASANPQADSRERVRQAILDYQRRTDEADRQRAANPLPNPACGR